MKRFSAIIISLFMIGILILPTNIMANDNMEIARSPQANGVKTFTLTKRPAGSTGDGLVVGEYDTFYDAMNNCKQEDLSNQYVITMNRDYDIPEDEMAWGKSEVSILLRSSGNNQYTLRRKGYRDYCTLYKNCKIIVQNVILDGNNDGQAFFIADNGNLTFDKGTIFRNFFDEEKADGPAIYMSGNSILNIEDGVIVENNTGKTNGGVFEANSEETTINVNGGIFRNNTCTMYGGVIGSWGNLNIKGGRFENNKAGYGGAIASFETANTKIENAIFDQNIAEKQGGAILNWSEIDVKNTKFNKNKADFGGAIFSEKKLVSANNTFVDNKASKSGGAIYLVSDADVNNSSFEKNVANLRGGAIYVSKDNNITCNIKESEFKESLAQFGGAIYQDKNSKMEIMKSEFKNNEGAYGGAISSSSSANIDIANTAMKLDEVKIIENKGLLGAGVFTAFPTEIINSNFVNNFADVHPQDNQKDPHSSGCGGALYILDGNTKIRNTNYEGNTAFGSGGAIYAKGYDVDDDGNIKGAKDSISLNISENTKFKSNTAKVACGGAIYIEPYEYEIKITDSKAYKNLATDKTTLFRDNKAGAGKFNPPTNYNEFENLKYSKDSDVKHETLTRESLLNNYDVNYKNDYRVITYDGNGGKFPDGKGKVVAEHKVNDEIKLIDAPKRDGYEFLYWESDGNQFKAGESYKITSDVTFVAKWKKINKTEDAAENKGGKISPLTGDNSHTAIYISIIILAIILVSLIIIIKKKKGDK